MKSKRHEADESQKNKKVLSLPDKKTHKKKLIKIDQLF